MSAHESSKAKSLINCEKNFDGSNESQQNHICYYKNTFTEQNLIASGRLGQVFRMQNKYDGKDYAFKKFLITGI